MASEPEETFPVVRLVNLKCLWNEYIKHGGFPWPAHAVPPRSPDFAFDFYQAPLIWRKCEYRNTAVWCWASCGLQTVWFLWSDLNWIELYPEHCDFDIVCSICLFSLSRSACCSLFRTYHFDSRKKTSCSAGSPSVAADSKSTSLHSL